MLAGGVWDRDQANAETSECPLATGCDEGSQIRLVQTTKDMCNCGVPLGNRAAGCKPLVCLEHKSRNRPTAKPCSIIL